MTTRFTIILSSSLLFGMQVFGHRPYDLAAGSFIRSDGMSVSAVEHYVDGIFGTDPVSVQFRLADGSVIGQTELTRSSVVVRRTGTGIDVYRFSSDWIPVADSVLQFDGFSLTDTSTLRKRLFSPLIHTSARWRDYAAVLCLGALLVVCWFAANAIPRRGSLTALRAFGFAAVGLATALYVLLVLLAVPVSPFIVCIFGGICVALCFPMRRYIRHAPMT